jgi:hypothetical protein
MDCTEETASLFEELPKLSVVSVGDLHFQIGDAAAEDMFQYLGLFAVQGEFGHG